MKHKLKLFAREKINIWLDLCEFSTMLMKKTMSEKKLNEKMERIRIEHLKRDRTILEKIGRLKSGKKHFAHSIE